MKIFKKSRSLLEVSYLYYFYLKRDKSLTKGVYSRAFGKEKKMAQNQGFIFEIYQKIPLMKVTQFLLMVIVCSIDARSTVTRFRLKSLKPISQFKKAIIQKLVYRSVCSLTLTKWRYLSSRSSMHSILPVALHQHLQRLPPTYQKFPIHLEPRKLV